MGLPRIIKKSYRGMGFVDIQDELFADRKIMLCDEINKDIAKEVMLQMMYLDKVSSDAIVLLIDSPGGSVDAGMVICDVIKSVKSPVITVCMSQAYSMGAVIFLQGDERIMLEHSKVMIHDPSAVGGLENRKVLEAKENLERIMKDREMLCTIIAERTGKDVDEIYELTKKDTFFDAAQSLDFGIATKIADNLTFSAGEEQW